jgi:hypothetical protein
MFNLFKGKSEKEKLEIAYKKCLAEAYTLSKTNRSASDVKTAEANEILKEIEKIN